MAFKRALVVDDSKTARQSLARLLAEHELEVAFADSGEAALDFLHHELVDVIFMDHTMPGMDGLEAVSAIKSNPRTATIPVMMYTTKEGEVYVSQARALGAVGVLPKQFNPGVLFEMLKKLGLVTDRRTGEPALEEPPPRRRFTDVVDEVDQEYQRRALGVSVQTLMQRVLEEQHLKLKSDILSGQRRFARQVAQEILEQHPAEPAEMAESAGRGRLPAPWAGALVWVLVLAVLSLTMFGWQMTAQRDAALLEVARLNAASRNELDALSQRAAGLDEALQRQTRSADEQTRSALASLQWALDQRHAIEFDALPFDESSGHRLGELLGHLHELGYQGKVTLTAVLAPFCLDDAGAGVWSLAAPDTAIERCPALSYPLGDTPLSALQTVAFATVLEEAQVETAIQVRLAVRRLSRDDRGRFPDSIERAADWNRLAASWQRLEYHLEPLPALDRGLASTR